jgi:hypothetical protein
MGKFEDNKEYTFDVDSAPIAWLDYAEELKEIAEIIYTFVKKMDISISRQICFFFLLFI